MHEQPVEYHALCEHCGRDLCNLFALKRHQQEACCGPSESALAARVAELEGVLGFYANPENWRWTRVSIVTERNPALADGGELARAALTPPEPTDAPKEMNP
jgi:hypothetical protein